MFSLIKDGNVLVVDRKVDQPDGCVAFIALFYFKIDVLWVILTGGLIGLTASLLI